MRDMMAKFGTQVESFRYAFVIPNHADGWEGNAFSASAPTRMPPEAARTHGGASPFSGDAHESDPKPIHRRRAGDKQPTYIEIKPA
jgi:hypothetical protein